MERARRLLLVAGLLAALLPAAAAAFGPQPGAPCESTLLATHVTLFCAPDMPTAQCCEPVVAAVDLGGGVPCLCRVAADPRLVMAGLNATHLLTLYSSCGGLRPGGAHLAAACEGPTPPAAVVSSPPPPPPSPAPRRKQPAHGAPPPPPPPSSEKPSSPPPQEHDGAAPHVKAVPVPVQAATSPFAPAAAIAPPLPPSSIPRRNQLGVCPSSNNLATAVAIYCWEIVPKRPCCLALRAVVSNYDAATCLCSLVENKAVKEMRLSIRHLVNSYTSCMGFRPGDVHLPAAGCDSVLTDDSPPPDAQALAAPSPPSAVSPPPSKKAHSPSNGIEAPPSEQTGLSRSDHRLLTAILVCTSFSLVLLVGALVVYCVCVCRKGEGWVRLRAGARDLAGDVELQPQRPVYFIFNGGPRQQPRGASSSGTTQAASSSTSEIVEPVLRRKSPRFVGQSVDYSGQQ